MSHMGCLQGLKMRPVADPVRRRTMIATETGSRPAKHAHGDVDTIARSNAYAPTRSIERSDGGLHKVGRTALDKRAETHARGRGARRDRPHGDKQGVAFDDS